MQKNKSVADCEFYIFGQSQYQQRGPSLVMNDKFIHTLPHFYYISLSTFIWSAKNKVAVCCREIGA